MTLSIRDDRLEELAEQARQILNVPTKNDAIREALERVVTQAERTRLSVELTAAQAEKARMLNDRLEALRAKYNMPPHSALAPFDEKAFLDEMWGDDDVHRCIGDHQ